MSSSHGMKCSMPAVQQRHISAADKTYFKLHFISRTTCHHHTGWSAACQLYSVQQRHISAADKTYFKLHFISRTTCHRHTGWSAAWQLYSRDIYQPRTKHISNHISLQDPMPSSWGMKCSPLSVQQRHISAADKTYVKLLHFITGPHVIVTRDEVQPDSCTAETYISREGVIYQKQCLSARCWKGRPAISLLALI